LFIFVTVSDHRIYSSLTSITNKLLLVIGPLLTFLLLVEIALRCTWLPPKLQSTIRTGKHPQYHYAILPGVEGVHSTNEYRYKFKHNLQRMRAPREFQERITPGFDKRILFIGDSFTYGIGVSDDETFISKLQAKLPTTELVNGGCEGYGTREELAVLHYLGPRLHPDLVVLVFFWNDLANNITNEIPDFKLSSAGKVIPSKEMSEDFDPLQAETPAKGAYLSHWSVSYLYQFVDERIRLAKYKYFGKSLPYVQTPEKIAQSWELTHSLLHLVSLRAKELNSKLLIVSIPDIAQLDASAQFANIGPAQYEVQEKLAEICRSEAIDLLDLRADLKREYEIDRKPMYYLEDRHLTAVGTEAVAKILLSQLQKYTGK
jgi:lysophospholipase L1-like esterase